MLETQILTPVVTLIGWSLVMWVWMYATRLPEIKKTKMQLDSNAVNGSQMAQLPAQVRWKADNYTHLMEQPTIFYAVIFSLVLVGDGGTTSNVSLAWGYVFFRVVHSLVQTLGNKIEVRFGFFVLSTLCLAGLVFNAMARAISG